MAAVARRASAVVAEMAQGEQARADEGEPALAFVAHEIVGDGGGTDDEDQAREPKGKHPRITMAQPAGPEGQEAEGNHQGEHHLVEMAMTMGQGRKDGENAHHHGQHKAMYRADGGETDGNVISDGSRCVS